MKIKTNKIYFNYGKSQAKFCLNKTNKIKHNIKLGLQQANRLAQQKHYGKFKTFRIKCLSVNRKLPQNFWYTVAGMFTPVPGGFILGNLLGRFVNKVKKR